VERGALHYCDNGWCAGGGEKSAAHIKITMLCSAQSEKENHPHVCRESA